jgi:hypothetical protein
MADEIPSLHIDTDWKKQAQEEKRKLAEVEKQKAAAAAAKPMTAAVGGAAVGEATAGGTSAGAGRVVAREKALPPPSLAALVQTLVTQVFFYLGDLTPRGVEPQLNLDMAKYQIDLLGVIEEKTKGNLNEEEQRLLDAALYETRMRFVTVSAQIVNS